MWSEEGIKSFEAKNQGNHVACLQWNKETDGAPLFATGHYNGVTVFCRWCCPLNPEICSSGTTVPHFILFLLQTVIVWDSESKRIVEEKKHHERGLREICWIADDSLASCSLDHTVVIHRIGTDEYEIFTHQVKLVELTTIQLINRNHKKIRNLNRIVCLGQSQCASMEQHVQAAGLLLQRQNCESKKKEFYFLIEMNLKEWTCRSGDRDILQPWWNW